MGAIVADLWMLKTFVNNALKKALHTIQWLGGQNFRDKKSCFLLLYCVRLQPKLGHHNFEFRSVSRFHGKCGRAGLTSISHFTTIFAYFWRVKELKNQNQDEAGFISHIKIDEKCEIHVTFRVIQWGHEAFPFHRTVNLGEAGGKDLNSKLWWPSLPISVLYTVKDCDFRPTCGYN